MAKCDLQRTREKDYKPNNFFFPFFIIIIIFFLSHHKNTRYNSYFRNKDHQQPQSDKNLNKNQII